MSGPFSGGDRIIAKNRYDRAGQLIDSWDELGYHRQISYHPRGWVSQITDPKGYWTNYNYEANGLPTGWMDSLGRGQSTQYDELDRVKRQIDGNGNFIDITYWEDSGPKEVTDQLGAVTYFFTNFAGRVAKEYRGYGLGVLQQETSSSFNEVGFVTSVTQSSSPTTGFDTFYVPNSLHQLFEIRQHGVGSLRKATLEYDGLGQVRKVHDGEAKITLRTRDGLERVDSITDPSNHQVRAVLDALGNKVADIDGLGHVTKYVFDALNRNTRIIDANGGITRKNYDALYLTEIIDPVGNSTRYVNDELGRPIQEIDPLGKSTFYQLDLAGRLTEVTDRLGRKRVFGYDPGDRKTTETWKNAAGATVDSFAWTYNGKNQVLTATGGAGGYTFTFDALGRPKTQTDPHGLVLTTDYEDYLDRVKKVSDSAGGNREYFYYNHSNANVSYDNVKYVTFSGTSLPNIRWDFSYDNRDGVTEIKRYSDLIATTLVVNSAYTYDPNGFLAAIDHLDATSNLIDYFHYAQNAANLVISEESKVSGSSSTRNFTYDNTNQLLTDGSGTSYSFDLNGNRTMAGYVIGVGNRVQADATWTYDWDDEGNLIERTETATGYVFTFGYNHRNQLTHVEKRDNTATLIWQATYAYDALGNRLSQTIDADGASAGAPVTTKFAYDQIGNAWADLDASGNITTRRLYLDAVDAVFAKIGSTGTVDHYLTDRLGSVRDIYLATGVLQKELDYDGFGKITLDSNPAYLDRYGFTGRELEPATRLQYNRGRWYSFDIGAWTSEDPLKFKAGDPNLYRYAFNSPTNHTDPTGQFVPLIVWGAIGIGTYFTARTVTDCEEAAAHLNAACAAAALPPTRASEQRWNEAIAAANVSIGSANRNLGMVQVMGGIAETALAIQGMPTRPILSSLVALHGMDQWFAGIRTIETGTLQPTFTQMGISNGLQALGVTEPTADSIAGYTDTALSVLGSWAVTRPLLPSGSNASVFTRLRRFFWDNRDFRSRVSYEYWQAKGPALGRELHHWLLPQRATWIPRGLRNAGFNLLEMPAWPTIKGLNLNRWMGFTRNWPWRTQWHQKTSAFLLENFIRLGIPSSLALSIGTGYFAGKAMAKPK